MNLQLDKLRVFDTHCHLQFPPYDQDREEVLKRARTAKIGLICVGTDLESSRKAIQLANSHEDIWASVGLHPNDNLEEKYDQLSYLELAKHPKVVAIGEVGLDYYRTTDASKKEIQKGRFLKQIELSHEVNRPLIIHCRDAHEDMINILSPRENQGVIHSFTGRWDEARKYIDLGFYIGMNGIITFTNQYNETVISAPLENILLETDAPYLAPAPYRGKRNEPAFIVEVAKKIGELRGISTEEVIFQTTQNTQKLFSL